MEEDEEVYEGCEEKEEKKGGGSAEEEELWLPQALTFLSRWARVKIMVERSVISWNEGVSSARISSARSGRPWYTISC